MYRLPFSPFVFSLLASVMLSGKAVSLEATGNAVSVDPAVNAAGVGGQRPLEVEGAVFLGDEIVSSPNGLAQIRFIDDTKIVIGPNSRLKIDRFVFNPDNTVEELTLSAARGVFRFITGNSPHEVYSIHTPQMTIGVRGSVVDFYVAPGSAGGIFPEGDGIMCDTSNNCVPTDTCSLWIALSDGSGMRQSTGFDRQNRIFSRLSFMMDDSRFDDQFRVQHECETADARFFGAPTESSSSKNEPRPRRTITPRHYDQGDDDDYDDYDDL